MNLRTYILSFLLGYYVLHVFGSLLSFIFSPLIFWSATSIFSISYTFESVGYGSGDTTYNYLETIWHLFFALILAFPFTGCAEVLGGLLLLNRRTATFGALVLTGVMLNVNRGFHWVNDRPYNR